MCQSNSFKAAIYKLVEQKKNSDTVVLPISYYSHDKWVLQGGASQALPTKTTCLVKDDTFTPVIMFWKKFFLEVYTTSMFDKENLICLSLSSNAN